MSYALPFVWGARTYLMGIVNVTPDSFSGDGLHLDLDAIVARARAFEAAGADIIDVGGESTRPGHEPVDEATEMARAIPAVRAIAAAVSVPISIDTYKAAVAEAALEAGARVVNDVWALAADPRMAELVARAQVPVILMHNQHGTEYRDLIPDIIMALAARVQAAEAAGIARERIIVDPGIGFGKTFEHNLEVMDRLDEFKVLGLPILLGTSRKRYIGRLLDGAPPEQRVEGTAAAVAIGIARGADIVRVHDVAEMARVVRVADAITRRAAPAALIPR
ncbi:MAG TPA: dihydropteroate synthase [Chloroflexota bacterium]|nr:dihydropteroate synthase [Chloroflexota bacterium]